MPAHDFNTQTRPADLILPRLEKVKQTGRGRWIACCPAHDDRSPSLGIREIDDGRILLHCFAGCTAAEIVSAVGLSLSDLFPQRDPERHNKPGARPTFYAADILRLIRGEAIIVLVAAYSTLQGKLCESDVGRLELAVERICNAVKLAGVRP